MAKQDVWILFGFAVLLTLLIFASNNMSSDNNTKHQQTSPELEKPKRSHRIRFKGLGKVFLVQGLIPILVELIATIVATYFIPPTRQIINNNYTTIQVTSAASPTPFFEPSPTPAEGGAPDAPSAQPTFEQIPEYTEPMPSPYVPEYNPATPAPPQAPTPSVDDSAITVHDSDALNIGTSSGDKYSCQLNADETMGVELSPSLSGIYEMTFDFPAASNAVAFMKDVTLNDIQYHGIETVSYYLDEGHTYIIGIAAGPQFASDFVSISFGLVYAESGADTTPTPSYQQVSDFRGDAEGDTYYSYRTDVDATYLLQTYPYGATDAEVTIWGLRYPFSDELELSMNAGESFDLTIHPNGTSDCGVVFFIRED